MRTSTKQQPLLMRAATTLLLAVLMLAAVPQRAGAQTPATIGGIEYNSVGGYYEIDEPDDLRDLATYVNGTGTYRDGTTTETTAHDCSGLKFKMTQDITFTYTTEWNDASSTDNNYVAIGCYYNDNDRYFRGDFDGADHTISGIRIYRSGDANADQLQGIFGQTDGATIHNLRLADARITGHRYTGGIVGYNWGGTVTDCHVASNVCIHAAKTQANVHSGIAGWNSGTVGNCTSAATLTIASDANGCNYYGAIAGYNGGTLHDNLAIGATVPAASNNDHGAIVGSNTGFLQRNYYTACKVAGVENATDVGCQNADVTADDGAVPALLTQNENTYTISNTGGWNAFCYLLADNEKGYFSGKTVKLGADITVTRMAGDSGHEFTGTFDGQGHTLTVNYGLASAPLDAEFVAPFVVTDRNTSPTFRNLTIDGHIYAAYTGSDDSGVGGLIGHLFGTVTIEGCTSTVEINSTKDRVGGFVGLCEHDVTFTNCKSSAVVTCTGSGSGFVGWSRASGHTIAFVGCLFNGKILKKNGVGSGNGGFVGWKGYTKTIEITDCLVDPAAVAEGETMADDNSATFCRYSADTSLDNQATSITNCYYTEVFGREQGTQAYSISKGEYVTTLEISGEPTNSYPVSGLDFYSVGLKCGDVLYAAENDVVSLTLGCTAPSGYYCTGYTATAGTLNGTTLTMPYGNVTINATLEQVPPVNYVDQNGETQQCTDYIWLTGTETTLGAEGQETWCVVHSTLNYSQGIQLLGNTHIILCDGAAMNIGTIDNPVSGSSFQEKVGFYGDGNNLSLYAQSGNTGALTIYSQSCSFFVKDLTIAGGNVNATSLSDVPVIFCDNLTVRRSSLEVHANYYAAIQANNDVTLSNVTANLNSSNAVGLICSNFAVDNSQLTVNARYQAIEASNVITLSNVTANINSSNGDGLVCSNFAVDHSQLTVTALYQAIQASNVITLGCTAATDFIKATNTSSLTGSYSGTVKIADGQTLYAGTNAYTGTLTDAQRQAIGGQKLTNVAPPTYDYIDLDGTGATHTAVVIDADYMPTSLSGWYIVQGTVNYTNTINLAGDTHIILADNAVMNVTVTGYNYGIQSTSGNNYSLFVYGQTGQSGELNVTSNSIACFISGGDITIAGGKVTASGRIIGLYAQYTNNNGGNVTIKNATVTATGTSYFGILSEYGGNITIDNSNVTATSTGSSGIYAGNGNITIDNSNVTATSTGSSGIYAENGNITIASGTVTASSTQFGIYTVYGSVTINGGQVMATGNLGIYTVNGSVTINGGQVSAIGNTYGIYAQNSSDNITLGWTNPTDYIYANKYYAGGTLSIAEGKTFIDEDGQTYSSTIAQADGAYPIDGKTLYPYSENAVPYLDENGQQRYCVAYTTLTGTETELGTAGQETWYVADGTLNYGQTITLSGDVHLILKDNAVMNVGTQSTITNGIGDGSSTASISIYGQSTGNSKGQLHVNASAVGIFAKDGNLTINGGEVVVTSSDTYGLGIFANGGNITINGGNVEATSSGSGSIGIYTMRGGNVVINGGEVVATSSADGGLGIYASGGNITINGGEVSATSTGTDMFSYGIYASNGNITINSGEVTANGTCGIYVGGGDITISGGEVEATGSENGGEGIIVLDGANGGSISISNATVTATGSIGIHAKSGITINSGTVTANNCNYYGIYASNCSLTISGGQVTANGNSCGILCNNNITLGWTNASDYIHADSYLAGGTLSIAEGKTFKDVDGNNYESGPVNASDINGKWLYPSVASLFTKTIAAHHTEEGVNYGWYLIASPLSGGTNAEAVAHLVNSETLANFDLYRFNQAAELEWENWKQQNSDHYHFNLEPGRGYLYANAADVNLVFAGTPYSGNGEVTITNVAGHPLSGWNLVGNPFSVDAYIGRDFYVLNEARSEVMPEASTGAIPSMEGVFVLAEQDEETVTFSTEALNKGRASKPEQVVLNLSRDRGLVIDRAIVRMGEGRTLPKFQLNRNSTKLYIPQDGKDYAIVTSEGQGEMPLNFKAEENGTYTISVDVDNVEMGYLHLIDNLTGADVDLLAPDGGDARHGDARHGDARHGDAINRVSTYTFTAKTTDYESRFKLVFAVGSSTGSDTFAFFSNGNIIVNGEGMLQVIDMTGRVLYTAEANSAFRIQHSAFPTPGVYVLRLINGEKVRTQKIVVE